MRDAVGAHRADAGIVVRVVEPYIVAGFAMNAVVGKTYGSHGERAIGIAQVSPDLAARGVPAAGGGVAIGAHFGLGVDVFLFENLLAGLDWRHNEMVARGADFETFTVKVGLRFGAPAWVPLERAFQLEPVPTVYSKVVETDEELLPLEPIRFALGDDAVGGASVPLLRQVADLLARKPSLSLRVEGHVDTTETDETLPGRRAEAVVRSLTGLGVEAGRLHAEGLGGTRHAASNDTEAGRARNRRTELHIVRATDAR